MRRDDRYGAPSKDAKHVHVLCHVHMVLARWGFFGLNQNDFGFIPHTFHALHHSVSGAFSPQDRANQKHGLREFMGQLLDRDGVRLLRTVLFGETDEHLKVLMIQP